MVPSVTDGVGAALVFEVVVQLKLFAASSTTAESERVPFLLKFSLVGSTKRLFRLFMAVVNRESQSPTAVGSSAKKRNFFLPQHSLHSWNFGLAVSYLEGDRKRARKKTLGDPAVE